MNKFLFFSALLFLNLGFASCSDDDEDQKDAEREAELVGTWDLAAYYSDVTMPWFGSGGD